MMNNQELSKAIRLVLPLSMIFVSTALCYGLLKSDLNDKSKTVLVGLSVIVPTMGAVAISLSD